MPTRRQDAHRFPKPISPRTPHDSPHFQITPNAAADALITSSPTPESTTFIMQSTVGMAVGMSVMGSITRSFAAGGLPIITAISGNTITVSKPFSDGLLTTGSQLAASYNIAVMRVIYNNYPSNTKIMLQSINGVAPLIGSICEVPAGPACFIGTEPIKPAYDSETGDLLYLNNQIPFTPSITGNEIISVSTVIKL